MFLELGKIEKNNILKFKNIYINWENLGSRVTQKLPILNLWMNWENLCPKFHCQK